MSESLKLLSSMATRLPLGELCGAYQRSTGLRVDLEAVGGVDAAQRVQAGERFDVVVLASPVIDQLTSEGHLLAGSRLDLVRSGVAVAVRAGATRPSIDTEAALKAAVLAAPTVGYSTGPSGQHLIKVFERWGILHQVRDRIVQARPGIPVGQLVAEGQVALGFQQLSELLPLAGIEILGLLPAAVRVLTTFSGGVASRSMRPDEARSVLAFMASPEFAPLKQRYGMQEA